MPAITTRLGIFGALCLLTLSGCAVSPADYAGTQPQLTPKSFFDGPLLAEGLFQDRSGKVKSRFVVHMQGTWQGDTGTLVEYFSYLDGTAPQDRTWVLTQLDEHRFTGTAQGSAGPVVGTARGSAHGYALRWDYRVDLPVGERSYRLHFDDWMWRLGPDTVINRTVVRKFGFRVGDATLVIRRLPDTPENRALVAQYPVIP